MSHVSTRPGPSPVGRPPRPRLGRVPYRAGILIGGLEHRAEDACPSHRSHEGLSPDSSLGPGFPGDSRGRSLRIVRPERRRKDDMPPRPLGPHASDRRTGDRMRSRRPDPTERSAQAARDPLRPPYALRGHDGPRLPRVLRADVRDPAGSGPRARRGGDARPRADPSSDVGAERTGTNPNRPPRPPRRGANRARPHRSRNRPPRNEEPRDHGRRLLSDHGGDAPDPARGCFLMEWRDRLQRIEAIVEKDLKVTKWWWIVAIIISATEFVAMTSVASNVRRMNDLYHIPFTWYDSNLRSLYAVSAFLTSMILGLAFSQVHGGEIRRGTIRSIILYPVDMNDVTIAKLASSFVLGGLSPRSCFWASRCPS